LTNEGEDSRWVEQWAMMMMAEQWVIKIMMAAYLAIKMMMVAQQWL